MESITEYFPYIYGALATVNTYHFLKKGKKDLKDPDSKLLFYGSLAAGIDMLPFIWGDSETLSQKAGLEFKTIHVENAYKGILMGSSFLGQIMGLYHNLGINKDFIQYKTNQTERKRINDYV